MGNVTTLGIDLAKNLFHIHGVDDAGRIVMQERVKRGKLSEFIANLPKCLIGMESCGGSQYWARVFERSGHEVRLMNPRFVTPYVKGNKNDSNDAEAICEAVTRPNMRFVGRKSIEQQDIQIVHRIRQRLVQERTRLVNQIRGLLQEYGVVLRQGVSHVRSGIPEVLEDADNELTPYGRAVFSELSDELRALDQRVKDCDQRIESCCRNSEVCKRLTQVEGIGPITATAIVGTVGDAHNFKNGREFAAWLGLVPRQHSTGGRPRLLGISKRGDRYLRTLLVQGGHAVVNHVGEKQDKRSHWIRALLSRRNRQITAVAVANKNARIIWSLLRRQDDYVPA